MMSSFNIFNFEFISQYSIMLYLSLAVLHTIFQSISAVLQEQQEVRDQRVGGRGAHSCRSKQMSASKISGQKSLHRYNFASLSV